MTEDSRIDAVRNKVEHGYATARDAATKAYDRTIDGASSAYDTTRKGARDVARRTARSTTDGIEGNPLAVLASGLALGAIAGAVIPRTKRETDYLGGVGKRLNDTAAAAARAARDAGKEELNAIGISRKAGREQVGRLLDGIVQAMTTAGDAAAKAAAPRK